MRLINSIGNSYLYKTGQTNYEIHSTSDIINSISLLNLELKDVKKKYDIKKEKNKNYDKRNNYYDNDYKNKYENDNDYKNKYENDYEYVNDYENDYENDYQKEENIKNGGGRPTLEVEALLVKKSFKANTVYNLKHYMTNRENKKGIEYMNVLKFLENIGSQLLFFNSLDKSVVFYSLEDIIVIDDEYFIFINTDKLFSINKETKNIIIDIPLEIKYQNSFIPLDIKDISVIPFELFYTSGFSSLAMLCIYLFLAIKIEGSEEDFERVSNPFIYTQLYFCLKRCIKNNPKDRVLCYV